MISSGSPSCIKVSPRNRAKTSSQASAKRACHRSPAPSFRDVDELFEQSPYPARSAFDILTVMTTSVALSLVISRMPAAMTKLSASPARLAGSRRYTRRIFWQGEWRRHSVRIATVPTVRGDGHSCVHGIADGGRIVSFRVRANR
jgi:hypothetical protein